MATFAVMSGTFVANVIVCDSRETAEEVTGLPCIEYTEGNPAYIGSMYDEATGQFVRPEPVFEEVDPNDLISE